MSSTSASTAAPTWSEFTHGMCEQLNCNRCLTLVGDEAMINSVKSLVDVACRYPIVTEAFAANSCCAPSAMPHVTFTTADNVKMVQGCMAVHGRIPFLAVIDMRDDDDGHSFLFDLHRPDGQTWEDEAFTTAVADFLVRVGRGTEPRSRQGAAPPPGDVFEPTHGAVLCEARAAVTSTFARLIGRTSATLPAKNAPAEAAASSGCGCGCGGLCVFWSDRCPCCPGVLMLVEAVVQLVRLVAARHADHSAGSVSFTFPFVVANIDDNDFSQAEWPVAQREQVVPCLVAYPAPSLQPVLFSGERSPARLASFICEHCLPAAEYVACTPHIAEEVAKVVANVKVEDLMTVVEEGSEAYTAATSAYRAFADAAEASVPTAETVEGLVHAFHSIRGSALPFSLETEVRRMSAEGGAAASGSLRESSLDGDEDGGEQTEEDAPSADMKHTGAAGKVAAPAVALLSAHKRPRE